jgi:hypothetical protein
MTYLRVRTVRPQRFYNPMSDQQLWGEPINFLWQTQWQTDATSGYIVQEVYTVFHVVNCHGHDMPVGWNRYFEAWRITGPDSFEPNGFDFWTIRLGNGRGTWSKTGDAFLVDALDPNAHFEHNPSRGAHALLSTTTQPTGLGPVKLHRRVEGEWEACAMQVLECFHRPRARAAEGGSVPPVDAGGPAASRQRVPPGRS